MTERFYSVAELAQLMNESESVWRKRLARRELSFVRCGANIRVPSSDLQRWLEKRLVKPNPSWNEAEKAEGKTAQSVSRSLI